MLPEGHQGLLSKFSRNLAETIKNEDHELGGCGDLTYEWLRVLYIWRLWEQVAWPGKCGKLISTLHLHRTSTSV